MKLVDLSIYSNEILTEGLGEGEVTEQDAQNALAQLYISYTEEQAEEFLISNMYFTTLTVESINLQGLWRKLKEIFCSLVREDSVFSKIIDFILEAIGQIIPLGVFVKSLVKIIIKYFLQRGIGAVCPV
ncbi:hypothetical protein KB553_11785 [Chryseobacterium rhizoplanae]|uniref:hypothetical protein n=1 Tax=Chryseobacterium rhizoplanae TaxID=1609531 RepID=UPI001CE3330C|nr:hypothetical protein [Chryseobacterium rhizoplanae]UCA57743.1 hypothetical protein KB553_11785 [Chryseobacterium rhizoplanae]